MMVVTVDKYTRFILTVIAVLLLVVSVGLWGHAPSTLSTANAAIPDSGKQLNDVISQLEAVKASVDKVQQTLTSGGVKVQIVTAEQVKRKDKDKGK
ncbi:MAG: hypothetical protein JEZ07_09320 [Phycisphaerae bacterium]|nr:hypothetical protein [Phycisphaerae bacterium]